MAKVKLDNVGEAPAEDTEVTFEDFSNPEDAEVGTPVAKEYGDAAEDASPTQESVAEPSDEELEAGGVNINEKDAQKKKRAEHKALMGDLKKLGEAHGAGKTSMIGLAERVTQAAMKDAIAPDDAGMIYDKFREAANNRGQLEDAGIIPDAAVMERAPIQTNDESRQAQVSKLRNFIELGVRFDETAYDLVRRARNIHIGLLAGDRLTLQKGSTYTILTGVASANAKRKVSQGVMTDAEIHQHLFRPAPADKPKDGVAKLEDALLAVQAAKKGSRSADNPRPAIDNPRLDTIIGELRQAIGEEDPARLQKILDEEAKAEAERIRKEDEKAERERNKSSKGKKKAA